MDTREENQKYKNGTRVTFLPTKESRFYKHYGEEGVIGFKERTTENWYIYLDKTEIAFPNHPTLRKEAKIRVIGNENEFKTK